MMSPPAELVMRIDGDAAQQRLQAVTFYAEQALAAVADLHAAIAAAEHLTIGISVENLGRQPRVNRVRRAVRALLGRDVR
jgi:hypothetical protein